MTNINKTYTAVFKNKDDIFRLFLLAFTALYCIVPLMIHQGLPYAHDIIFHVFQADQFDRVLHEGNFYPRWVQDSNNGYGSANFIFYAPLSYYLVSAIKMFTPSLTNAMRIAIWCGIFFSGITMFVATRKMFGASVNALPAVVYQIIPFHLWNIYIRGTFAEFFAFVWFPLIILFLNKTIESRDRNAVIGLSVSYAGLILTHLVSAYIFSIVIGLYFIYNFFFLKKKKMLLQPLFSLALGLGLSSIYLMPVIFERKFVQIEYIINCPVGDYRKNFLFTWDKVQTVLRNFYLPIHISVSLEVIVFLFIMVLIRKNRQIVSHRQMVGFFPMLFLFAFFLTTPLSRPMWDLVPSFPFLQFPWRWIPMMEVSVCFLIAVLFSFGGLSDFRSNALKRAVVYLLVGLSLMSFITIIKSKVIPDTTIITLMGPEKIQKVMDPPLEYTPVWVNDIETIMSENINEKVTVIEGEAQVHIIEWKSEKRVIDLIASMPTLIRIATFYFPGWDAEIDGKRTQINIQKENGAMLIDIPEGKHRLVLEFGDTPIRYYSKFISLASVLIMFFGVLLARKTGLKYNKEDK
jgi:hypothetical protein